MAPFYSPFHAFPADISTRFGWVSDSSITRTTSAEPHEQIPNLCVPDYPQHVVEQR
jgi:hypothetical protein